jgi:hypothetical protein
MGRKQKKQVVKKTAKSTKKADKTKSNGIC